MLVLGLIVIVLLVGWFLWPRRMPYEGTFIEMNGERRSVVSYDPTLRIVTINRPWSISPDNSSVFVVKNNEPIYSGPPDALRCQWCAMRLDHFDRQHLASITNFVAMEYRQ